MIAGWLIAVLPLCILAGCTAQYTGNLGEVDAGRGGGQQDAVPIMIDAAPDAIVTLSKTPGTYRGACDGSAAIALDFDHFAGFSDNDQRIRVYKRGVDGTAIQSIDIAAQLGVASGAKVDFEDVERLDNRIYAISSHGRKNDGVLDADRYRFVAIDVTGQAPTFQFAVAGSRARLLQDLLATENWSTPDTAIITALKNASQLDQPTATNLAPKVSGLNIEGLARAPIDGQDARLVIGLRNPRPNGKAIVVSLLNAADVIANPSQAFRFGEAFALDLGGLGIRGMTWLPSIREVLIIAGPHDDASGPFKLYRWRGLAGTTPSFVKNLSPSSNLRPEGLVTYPGTADVEIVADGDDQMIGTIKCDDAASAQRSFSDQIEHVE